MNASPEVLSSINKHPRDANIKFREDGHIYTIGNDSSQYTSVTTWYSSMFKKFDADQVIDSMVNSRNWNETHKYWGMTRAEIKTAWKNHRHDMSDLGTRFHKRVELFMNNPTLTYPYNHVDLLKNYTRIEAEEIPEWNNFLQFVRDTPEIVPFRTEWTIYDKEVKLAGCVDMLYVNPDGTLTLIDWKRVQCIEKESKFGRYATNWALMHVPDTNYWHYALQLNIYKKIIEKNYGKVVSKMAIVRCHPNSVSYEIIEIENMDAELDRLFASRKIECQNLEIKK